MRAGNNSTAPSPTEYGGGFQWNSPIPYLFCGLALMLGLIAVALTILACSYKKSSQSDNPHEQHDDHQRKRIQLQMETEMEPKIVVIMAGDNNPTFFAKPDVALHLPK